MDVTVEDLSIWMSELSARARGLFGQFVEFLPDLVCALLMALVGWILARLLRSACTKLAVWFNGLVERSFGRNAQTTSGCRPLRSR